MMEKIAFSKITKANITQQKRLLFVALWLPDDETPLTMGVLTKPHIREYFENWGQKGDLGFFALDGNKKPIGIIQIRNKSSLTLQHANCPELAIAVDLAYRRQGVASMLFHRLFAAMEKKTAVRLSVHAKNKAAISLYKKQGFRVYDVTAHGYLLMVKEKTR